MSPVAWLALAILLMALLETPLFVVIAALSMAFLFFADLDFQAIQLILIEMNRLTAMPVLVALPLFTLVGTLLTATSAPRRMMAGLQALVGWLPGGMAASALIACALFTALTGASGVTILALGGMLLPLLQSQGYSERFSMGLLTTSGSQGLLFPPSLPVILFGIVAQVDIGRLFKAALVPGLLLVAIVCVYGGVQQNVVKRAAAGDEPPLSLARALRQGLWEWPIVGIILAGVYGGFVTVAEVAVLVVCYTLIVACWIRREIDPIRQLPGIFVEAAMLSGAVVLVLGTALGFTGYLVDQQIPQKILAHTVSLTDNRWLFLAGLNLFLLAVGCLMDVFSAIIIVVPLILPLAKEFGIDPIHLAVIFLINLEIGYSTPPIGMNLFLASLRFDRPIVALYRASWPFLLLMLAVLALVTYLPGLTLFTTN